MDKFVSRKRRKISSPSIEEPLPEPEGLSPSPGVKDEDEDGDEDSTDVKLAILASLHPTIDQPALLDLLISLNGSVQKTLEALKSNGTATCSKRKVAATIGYQSSLTTYARLDKPTVSTGSRKQHLTKKGQTLHLYSPDDIADHTPCSIIHNFLPPEEANNILLELLEEAKTFKRNEFKLFDNVVQSPHTAQFYVDSQEEKERQEREYVYNGRLLTGVRQLTSQMRDVSIKVRVAVNAEIKKRIEERYPGGKKLKYQSPKEWIPNAAFVNCYAGGAESVGYHSDQLTYLGPRSVIGSLSLGVAREFRVRKILGRDEKVKDDVKDGHRANSEGQIAIHLPHNSLLVMHSEMQEEWKHSIAPAAAIDPHPISGNKRINVTYRCYRDSLHPKYTPKCKCGVAAILRCVQRSKENRGRYMWTCDVNAAPGKEGCGFFTWAEFDDDGEPPWAHKVQSAQLEPPTVAETTSIPII
ncbi:MAG: hypothetical protein M1834_009546 [Cirrosporium novae-zelandiae]|nr:MAG: hypothetical protein M1834_009546 [Cirrosporium novae-zelandiae]